MEKKSRGKLFWLSYDLGLKGDYEGLYYWLDLHKGRECGGNVAVFYFKPEGGMMFPLLDKWVEEIKNQLEKNVKFGQGDRVYIIYKLGDKIKGKFIIGKRKPAPWAGYAPVEGEAFVDEE